MGKTNSYTMKAIRDYIARNDKTMICFRKGTLLRIREKYGPDISYQSYIRRLIEEDLSHEEPIVIKKMPVFKNYESKTIMLPGGTKQRIQDRYHVAIGASKSSLTVSDYIRCLISNDLEG